MTYARLAEGRAGTVCDEPRDHAAALRTATDSPSFTRRKYGLRFWRGSRTQQIPLVRQDVATVGARDVGR